MEDNIDKAIERLAGECADTKTSAPDAINFSQAALNLANCKQRMKTQGD